METLAPAIPLPPLTRVAVIGAGGPSGLVAVKQLLEAGVRPDQIAAFEARDRAGGVWNYEASPGPIGVRWRKGGPPAVRSKREIEAPGSNGPSAMYDRLRTNLPNSVMMYRGNPFPEGTPIFPTHQEVLAYLQSYAAKDGLQEHISWNTRVLHVYHTEGTSDPAQRWTVGVEQTLPSGEKRRYVDKVSHVIVSNGHYNEPFIPPIRGLDTFEGEILHSRWWRNPLKYRDKNVVVVGSRASGSDIARELAVDDYDRRIASRTIYQSVRGLKPDEKVWDDDFAWAKEISVIPEIDHIEGKTLYLVNGTIVENIDVIVFATGYLYSYPFFARPPFDKYPVTRPLASGHVGLPRVGGQTIENLNNTDTFYLPDPTLAFIGLHYAVNPFPLGEATARLIAHSFVHGEIPPLPPLRRLTDDPKSKHIGFPAEFDNQDAWLLAIGEGGEDGGPQGGWPKITPEVREARANALKTRKAVLGY